mgnify:FL=1|tara:strand:+ start:291 stop:479 length:189 start_codon:yes stop_codon:yes gene_type:complete
MIYFYNTHEDIPNHVQDYVMSCADVSDIYKLSITDINAFLTGVDQFEAEVTNQSIEEVYNGI